MHRHAGSDPCCMAPNSVCQTDQLPPTEPHVMLPNLVQGPLDGVKQQSLQCCQPLTLSVLSGGANPHAHKCIVSWHESPAGGQCERTQACCCR